MYLLDTMIPSELRKGRRANPGVLEWTRRTPRAVQYLSVVSILEMRRGALQIAGTDLVQSRALHQWLDGIVGGYFAGRVLAIDRPVVERCAPLHVPAQREPLDMFIAATALEYDFTLITRNVRHFVPTGVKLLNPFT